MPKKLKDAMDKQLPTTAATRTGETENSRKAWIAFSTHAVEFSLGLV